MKKKDIEKLKGDYAMQQFGEYLILYGRDFRIYDLNGSLIAKKAWRNAGFFKPLSDTSILLWSGIQKAFLAVSIPDGEELWRIHHPGKKISISPYPDFTINRDRTYAYQLCDRLDGGGYPEYYLAIVDIASRSIEVITLRKGLRAIHDVVCNSDGVPCLLEGQSDEVGGKTVSQNGVRLLLQDPVEIGEDPGAGCYYQYKWETVPGKNGRLFFDGPDVILTHYSQLFFPKTGEYKSLVKDTELDIKCLTFNKSTDGRYLQMFEPHGVNNRDVVIDMQEQRLVAQYIVGFPGCIVGDEYWSVTKEGFKRRPFPLIEEYHPRLLGLGDIIWGITEN